MNVYWSFVVGFTLLFTGLKLTDNLDWSWIWVLSPIWVGLGICLLILLAIWVNAAQRAKREPTVGDLARKFEQLSRKYKNEQ